MMTYSETLDYLFKRLPMFQRIGAAAYKANLDNTNKIIELLGHPEQKFKSVHIAGTNGKGSASHMIAAILQKAGYKTGLYTSPHLIDFRERIKINGKMISKSYIQKFVEKYKHDFEKIEPSFFEWTVGLAFKFFAEQKVDIAIIEVGLGGRLDSTNVIHPLVSVITNIGYDHTQFLGNTMRKIASEKAGIIKSNTPVVISQTQIETKSVFQKIAKRKKSPILFADQTYSVRSTDRVSGKITITGKKEKLNLQLGLKGSYQLHNIKAVLATVELLRQSGFKISKEDVKYGVKHVVELNGLYGRWQQLHKKPLIYTDIGHNEDGIKVVLENIRNQHYTKLHVVFGVVNDKDIAKILDILPKKANYYFVKSSVERSLDQNALKDMSHRKGLKGESFPDVKSGFLSALEMASKADLIFIGGSTFVVADLLAYLRKNPL